MKNETYHTFEELVEYAKSQGATHLTMGNYHSGAFWVYEAISLKTKNLFLDEVMRDIVDGPMYVKRLTKLAWISDSDSSYTDWKMTEWNETGYDPKHPTSQFIPIDQAVDWYLAWNKHYSA